MKQFVRVSALIFLILTLAGCSNRPSDDLVEDLVKQLYENEYIKITKVERLDGYIDQDGDYAVDVRYTAQFTQSYKEVESKTRGVEKFALGLMSAVTGEWKKGDTYVEEETFYFVESENGWRPL